VSVQEPGHRHHQVAASHREAGDRRGARGFACQQWDGRVEAQRFLDDGAGKQERGQIVEARRAATEHRHFRANPRRRIRHLIEQIETPGECRRRGFVPCEKQRRSFVPQCGAVGDSGRGERADQPVARLRQRVGDQRIQHGVYASARRALAERRQSRQPFGGAKQGQHIAEADAALIGGEGRDHVARRRFAHPATEHHPADDARGQRAHRGQHVDRRVRRQCGPAIALRHCGPADDRQQRGQPGRMRDRCRRWTSFTPARAVADDQPVPHQRRQRAPHLRRLAFDRRRVADECRRDGGGAVADQDAAVQQPGGEGIEFEVPIVPDLQQIAPHAPEHFRHR